MKVNRLIAFAVIALLIVGAMGLVNSRSFARTLDTHHQQTQTTSMAPAQSPALEDPATGPDTDTIQEQVGEQVEDGQPDSAEAPGVEETSNGPDTDTIQEQAGNQVEDGLPDNPAAPAENTGSNPQVPGNSSSPTIQGMSSTSGSPNQANITFINAPTAAQAQGGQPEGTEAPGSDTGPDVQSPSYSSSISVDQTATDGMSEADEAAALADQAKITVDQAKAAALAANPGTTVVKAELDNENGALVYSVELSNGSDVKVDAGNGAILHTETGGDNEG